MSSREKLKIGAFVLIPARGVLAGADGEAALEPKVVDVLLTLAARPGEVVGRDELVEAVWKAEFGADERVTRAISLLRKAFGDERGAPRYIETVSKRGYRLVAAVGPAPDDDATASAEAVAAPPPSLPPQKTARKWTPWRLAAAAAGFAAALAFAGVAAFRPAGEGLPASAQEVVELAPLRVIGGEGGSDAVAERVHASLKRVLASTQVLLVDRRTAKPRVDAPSAFTLSGTLERTAGEVAVTVFFDNGEDGQTLWSQRFARAASDVEVLREEIAVNTAFVIGCALKERRSARAKPSIEAFKIYLQVCEPGTQWASDGRKLALARRLTEIAPDDPFGHGLRAYVAAGELAYNYDVSETQAAALSAEVRSASARALELDPGNKLALIATSTSRDQATNWLRQDVFMRASIDFPVARKDYFAILRSTGRLNEALHVVRQSVSETDVMTNPRLYLGVILMQLGEHEDAERFFQEGLRLGPDKATAGFYRLSNAAFYGEPAEALKLVDGAVRSRDAACWRTFIEARARGGQVGDRSSPRKTCPREHASDYQYLARMAAALGDVDGAYDVLKDVSFDWPGSTIFLFYPEMAAFRKDARFMAYIAPSGLIEAWIATDRWPDFCRDKSLPYDCKTAAQQPTAAKAGRETGKAAQR